ncbi:DUF3592 domain-containing protein [Proteus vulgaris]|uniref:DUF3592 domain-containing protein n=1 Tax=Proteus vulgaris TaxID=585 RepID=UPI0018E4C0BF|nr:DUF3592 domain-containing protein [Proteus vulgaris]MBI6530845.1 DUF3592 domain-containing protein [Proteus vulgaris]
MKKFKFLFYIFAIIGVVIFIVALFVIKSELHLVRNGIETTGVIIDLSMSNSSNERSVYHPIIQFTTNDNREITFRSLEGSNPPRFHLGENISVIYLQNDPQRATINNFLGLYGAGTILGVFGLVFALTGLIPLYFIRRRASRDQRLKRDGMPINVKISEVIINNNIRINRRSPYQIIADYHDTLNNRLIRYKSGYIFFDPTPYINKELVTVYVDKRNPKIYYLDISFLPSFEE